MKPRPVGSWLLITFTAMTVACLEGCTVAVPDGEDVDQVSSELVASCTKAHILANVPDERRCIFERAFEWVDDHVMYSQTPQSKYGGYRTDCSGYVSYSWGLPPPGILANDFHNTSEPYSKKIDWADLQPGDAIARPGHVLLFAGWLNSSHTAFCSMEEYNWDHPASILTRTRAGLTSDYDPVTYEKTPKGCELKDTDGDKVPDIHDNCKNEPNHGQEDLDKDGKGDKCDGDIDGDGVSNAKDNCPRNKNKAQTDLDKDGKGDKCDGDVDGDGLANEKDNCPRVKNADQLDTDKDGKGNACEKDDDNDGVPDAQDNCSTVKNADQEDLDGDGKGDDCDEDQDGDGVANGNDNCPQDSNPDQLDADSDGEGDACDETPGTELTEPEGIDTDEPAANGSAGSAPSDEASEKPLASWNNAPSSSSCSMTHSKAGSAMWLLLAPAALGLLRRRQRAARTGKGSSRVLALFVCLAATLSGCTTDVAFADHAGEEEGLGQAVEPVTCAASLAHYPVAGPHNGGYDSHALHFTCPAHPATSPDNSDFIAGQHFGNDIFGEKGTPIVSATNGKVIFKGYTSVSGHRVTIQDKCGWHYFYAHLNSYASGISVGSTVQAGDKIGTLGNTGSASSTAPHLHFSIYPSSYEAGIDPFPHLKKVDGTSCAKTCTAHCQGNVAISDDCSKDECSASQTCVEVSKEARCVADACAAKPSTKHDVCLASGKLGHCSAVGKLTSEKCPAGSACVVGSKGGHCEAQEDAGGAAGAGADAGEASEEDGGAQEPEPDAQTQGSLDGGKKSDGAVSSTDAGDPQEEESTGPLFNVEQQPQGCSVASGRTGEHYGLAGVAIGLGLTLLGRRRIRRRAKGAGAEAPRTRIFALLLTIGASLAGAACTVPATDDEPTGSVSQDVSAPLAHAYCSIPVKGKGTKSMEDDYLPHVITCENGGADLEALKTQAIAARSVAYYAMATSGSICDSQGCQVYSCGATPSARAKKAVDETRGMYLSYGGMLTYGFYVSGDPGTDPPSCVGSPGYSMEKWVTYNHGKTGHDVEQTPLGGMGPPGYGQNRGCMSQWGARCLEAHKGYDYKHILQFYYGDDIKIIQATGSCVSIADKDKDGISDDEDNCKTVKNASQIDTDHDGHGDACDGDDDGDGVKDDADNCPKDKNAEQIDSDKDGKGNACDADNDNDSVKDEKDNCPNAPNKGQLDTDKDGKGDACDGDDDNDGIGDEKDNCPTKPNKGQADTDSDGKGDACEADDDEDGIPDADDNCPKVPNLDQLDADEDGKGDACDDDRDGDTVPNAADNCPDAPNADQADGNGNGAGDACDVDGDGDGVPDSVDVCPQIADPGQKDVDEDGLGDVCDPDLDGDEVLNEADGCPSDAGDSVGPEPAAGCPAAGAHPLEAPKSAPGSQTSMAGSCSASRATGGASPFGWMMVFGIAAAALLRRAATCRAYRLSRTSPLASE
ncbi:MAG: thrombospondin type 3 repeat-containing protein [Deltaproteobacteria bacterium]|nr:thrombospondin type 3 repeat-containing protein [Deltaproteobacteria bacterium]